MSIPTITVPQPRAALIAHGIITVEARTLETTTFGLHTVVASADAPHDGASWGSWWYDAKRNEIHDRAGAHPSIAVHVGTEVGTVEVYGCVPIVNASDCRDRTAHICTTGDGSGLLHSPLDKPWEGGETEIDVTEIVRSTAGFNTRPFAWLLRNAIPT